MKFFQVIFVNTVAQTQEIHSFLLRFWDEIFKLIWVILELSRTFGGKYFCTNIQLFFVFKEHSAFSHDTCDCDLQKNSCVLPEDLKNFYLMTDGFQMTWSVKTDGESMYSSPPIHSFHCSKSFLCRNLFNFKLTFCTVNTHLSASCISLSKSRCTRSLWVKEYHHSLTHVKTK